MCGRVGVWEGGSCWVCVCEDECSGSHVPKWWVWLYWIPHLHREENDNWILEDKLEAHTDWVRDVAWAPSVGLPLSRIASCSQVRRCTPLVNEFSYFSLSCVEIKSCTLFKRSLFL